ncbi:MAG: hypothetical protein ACD_50C00012G0002 [uncultured bacterium]|nr:MAG: hypothetical protein ACD_50C00012G0002 [uncultured bacterium]
MFNQKGIAHLILIFVILAILIVAGALVLKKFIKIPGLSQTQESNIAIKSEYKNPFNKDSQYVNPFDQYKSPFITFQQ